MIKGLAITPPIIGRISIGRVIERNGKRLPEKDDQFTITTQVQGRSGWINHPLDSELRKDDANSKLRAIPVRLLFNDPELNLRAEFSLFDRHSGRPLCVGNGETCKRFTHAGLQTLPCPAPEACELAKQGCKPYGRLNVKIGAEDDLGSFIFRTTGFNSIRTLSARLLYFQAVSGNRLAFLPLELRIRGKSTAQSFQTPIYYVDLTTRQGMTLEEAIHEASTLETKRSEMGFDQDALDQAARKGLSYGVFEDTEEDVPDIVDEFYPPAPPETRNPASNEPLPNRIQDKLERKVAALNAVG